MNYLYGLPSALTDIVVTVLRLFSFPLKGKGRKLITGDAFDPFWKGQKYNLNSILFLFAQNKNVFAQLLEKRCFLLTIKLEKKFILNMEIAQVIKVTLSIL